MAHRRSRSRASTTTRSTASDLPTRGSPSSPSSPASSSKQKKIKVKKEPTDISNPDAINADTEFVSVTPISWVWTPLCLIGLVAGPLVVFYCWVCAHFYQGKLMLPASLTLTGFQDWFVTYFWSPLLTYGIPSTAVVVGYLGWLLFQAGLMHFLPGPTGQGPLLPDGKSRLTYKYNGQLAFLITCVTVFALHYLDVIPVTVFYDYFAQLQIMCNLTCYGVILLLYVRAWSSNTLERRTTSPVYDYFMGPQINPRFGSFDVKFFFELRPGIMHWFFTTVACIVKQYQGEGTVCTPMLLVGFYHFCFVQACYKGEQCVPQTMDIAYEKFGWMLIWLDIVVVPFIFPLQTYTLQIMGPFEWPWWFSAGLFITHCFGYWLFDTVNSQKTYFRGGLKTGYPRLPWAELKNPRTISTSTGKKLLVDGWWQYARHMNYLGDLMMAWSWAMTCGFSSIFPYAYTAYLTPLLLHRERRDDRECRKKYGEDWDRYVEMVPYRMIPGIY